MARFLAKRVLYELLTLFLIVTATFFLIAGAPGDPIDVYKRQSESRFNMIYGAAPLKLSQLTLRGGGAVFFE